MSYQITPLDVARKLQDDTRGLVLGDDTHGVVNRTFADIVGNIIYDLRLVDAGNTPADKRTVMGLVRLIAHQQWKLAGGQNSPALDPIETWMARWCRQAF